MPATVHAVAGQHRTVGHRERRFTLAPGRFIRRPDIVRPTATEMPSITIATMPNARLANQNSWWLGSTGLTRRAW